MQGRAPLPAVRRVLRGLAHCGAGGGFAVAEAFRAQDHADVLTVDRAIFVGDGATAFRATGGHGVIFDMGFDTHLTHDSSVGVDLGGFGFTVDGDDATGERQRADDGEGDMNGTGYEHR